MNNYASWLTLSKICDAFLSKATLAFSLATCVLANFSDKLALLGIDSWRFRTFFVGSVLFLIGYIWVLMKVRGATIIDSVVSRMMVVSNIEFFVSRRGMLKALVNRFQENRPFDMPEGAVEYAGSRISATVLFDAWDSNKIDDAATTLFNKEAGAMYHADLNLRQFDRPAQRYVAFALLASSIILLAVPTGASILKVFASFF